MRIDAGLEIGDEDEKEVDRLNVKIVFVVLSRRRWDDILLEMRGFWDIHRLEIIQIVTNDDLKVHWNLYF